jgi:DNA-binding NarL/FixJ family response regulator
MDVPNRRQLIVLCGGITAPRPTAVQAQPLTVVIFDDGDNPDRLSRFRFRLMQMARALGIPIRVVLVHSLAEAIARLPGIQPHVILQDLGGVCNEVSRDLHDPITGMAAVAVLKDLCPYARIVVVSRLHESSVVGRLILLGADGFYQKDDIDNLPDEEFARKVHQLLELPMHPSPDLVFTDRTRTAWEQWLGYVPPDARSTYRPVIVLRESHAIVEEGLLSPTGAAKLNRNLEAFHQSLGREARLRSRWRDYETTDAAVRIVATKLAPQHVHLVVAEEDPWLREPLSRAEQRVLEEIAAGCSYRETAARLALHEATVESHVRSARDKLGLPPGTRAAFVALAARGDGLVRIDASRLVTYPRLAPAGPASPPPRETAA